MYLVSTVDLYQTINLANDGLMFFMDYIPSTVDRGLICSNFEFKMVNPARNNVCARACVYVY